MKLETFIELNAMRARLLKRSAPIGSMSPLWDFIGEIDEWVGRSHYGHKTYKTAEALRDSLLKHFQRWPDDDSAVS